MMKKTETNLKQIAYETIKRKIIHCDYMPNDILSEMMKSMQAGHQFVKH